ncbi:50S ribosomal protein L31 [Brachybacterium sp. FME24]|uniref:50S ribosomal protein L31 n=1 Tax=Brachybacterium sp. FME24 TaxID=2742605 RepID=UPI0018688F1A|nr:50S ribosomal protein L31 [Brachybacterium sp. FME24]
MKNTHNTQYRTVVFRDQSADVKFLTRSNRATEHSTTWEDGNVYPVIDVDVSSAAHLARRRTAQKATSGRRPVRSRRRESVDAGRA